MDTTPHPALLDTIHIAESANILKAAKNIFGEKLVQGAWAAQTETSARREAAEQVLHDADLPQEEHQITIPTPGEILIRFCNGRLVHFTNSEWATISLVEDQLVVIQEGREG
jgi:hypothetical protein